MCLRQNFIYIKNSVFYRCKLNVCVLPHEFSVIHLHGFLTTLPLPRLGLILSCVAYASSMLPRSRENCHTHIIAVSLLCF